MRIVCSIDESPAARSAAEVAGQLASRLRAELVFVHSVTGNSTERVGVRSNRRCGLLIVGSKARSRLSSALLGEAHQRLVRDASCPVMLVPAGARLHGGSDVVLGYDVSRIRSTEAAAAGRMAAALDSSLVLAHVEVGDAPNRDTDVKVHQAARRVSQEATAAAGKRLDVHVVQHVTRRGRPLEHLNAVAASHGAGVIVIGGHRTGWQGAFRRSPAAQLHRHGRRPVLVVRRRVSLLAG
jgi:nucleotide-binding universal stress UspA family protein